QQNRCVFKWKKAKESKDFTLVADELAELIELERTKAQSYKESTAFKNRYAGSSLYEVMLDQYEPGFPVQKMRELLKELGEQTKTRVDVVIEKQASANHPAKSFEL